MVSMTRKKDEAADSKAHGDPAKAKAVEPDELPEATETADEPDHPVKVRTKASEPEDSPRGNRPETKPDKHSRHEPAETAVNPLDPAVVEVRETDDGTWVINDPTADPKIKPTSVRDRHGAVDPDDPPGYPSKADADREPVGVLEDDEPAK